jgi:hypothetical protein
MLFSEIIAVCYENHRIPQIGLGLVVSLCGQNAEVLNVKTSDYI